MTELLYAVVAAPVVVLPAVTLTRWLWPKLVALHRAVTWPWRIVIALLAVKFATEAFVAVEAVRHVAR